MSQYFTSKLHAAATLTPMFSQILCTQGTPKNHRCLVFTFELAENASYLCIQHLLLGVPYHYYKEISIPLVRNMRTRYRQDFEKGSNI